MEKTKRTITGYKKFMSDSEIRQLIEYVNLNCTDQIKLIFYIAVFMGLRIGEIVSLKRDNLQGNKLVFELEKSGRIHERVIPDFLLKTLLEYINKHNITDGFIFSTKYSFRYNGNNEHIQTATLRHWLKKFRDHYHLNDVYYTCKDNKKLHRVSMHTLRHWFLVKSYEKSNKDVLLVADIIGHKKLETTFAYLRAWNKSKREEKIVNQIALI